MEERKIKQFETDYVSLPYAHAIVTGGLLDDETIPLTTKMYAIEKVANMETHNSVKKDDLINALRFIFDNYEFGE